MYLYGSFITQAGETVTVHIVTENSRAKQVEIGDEKSGVFFTVDPVEIVSCVNDTFDHILCRQASIRLLTANFIPELFCASCMDAVVNIFKEGKCIFAGYVEPQTYSQDFNEVYDELQITCIDALSALQNAKYRNIGGLGVLYDFVKAEAGQRTFAALINEILETVTAQLQLIGDDVPAFYYDGSKALFDISDRYGIFEGIAISELLFLGDDEESVLTADEVLKSLLQYLNLHIEQDGFNFYIFSWESITAGAPIEWKALNTGASLSTECTVINISGDNVSDTDTTISIGEVYNKVSLTCKVEEIENIIESPLDENELTSPYTRWQKYMTEYSSEGEGKSALSAFWTMVHGFTTSVEHATITDWYVQVMNHPRWTFPETGTAANLVTKYCSNNSQQQVLPNLFPFMPAAGLFCFGKIEYNGEEARKDRTPIAKLDTTNYLVISVNGNEQNNPQTAYPNAKTLYASAPYAVFNGGVSGAVYSPTDPKATNYIVFSGKIVLNPIMKFSANYRTLTNWTDYDTFGPPNFYTVPSRNNGDGRYYTQKYYKADTPFDSPVWDENTARGLVPYTGTGPELYEFKYGIIDGIGYQSDTVSKVGVLACMLVIGDKCLVENYHADAVKQFEWKTYKALEQCADADEYYSQSFTIGFDPKLGDKLIGQEYDFQNTVDFNMGIDAEGMAVPITAADKLSGSVRFTILGPVNAIWDDVVYRHSTWFRESKWSANAVPLLSHVSSIIISSFEVKIYSDNGGIIPEENDLIYTSDTGERFINPKDDIEFLINSALTIDECRELGVSDTVKLSTPLNVALGAGLLTIYDRNKKETAKPEQLYVDSYYKEYHKPRIILTQKLQDKSGYVNRFNHYRHPALPEKLFYVQGISYNVMENSAELTLKEIWND